MAEHTLRVRQGSSQAADARVAVGELRDAIHAPDEGLVIVFASARYDLESLGQAIRGAFDAPVIGCTTAGEIASGAYADSGIVGASITSARLGVEQVLIERAGAFDAVAAERLSSRLANAEARARKRLPDAKSFGVLVSDGLCRAEEQMAGNLHIATQGMPLVGGSAGDDLALRQTHVYWDGAFVSDAAVLTMISTTHPFAIARSGHVRSSADVLVVTEADPARRTVTEFNGKPAAREYAQLLGLTPAELVPAAFARRPLVIQIGREHYVRGVASANGDELQFLCAVDTGAVLSVSRDEEMVESLRGCFARALRAVPEPRLALGFESVLRKLALREVEQSDEAQEVLRLHDVIGFHGYGEQYNALHLNQAFTLLLIGE